MLKFLRYVRGMFDNAVVVNLTVVPFARVGDHAFIHAVPYRRSLSVGNQRFVGDPRDQWSGLGPNQMRSL